MINILVAADISVALPCLDFGFGVVGLGATNRLLSTDWDLLGPEKEEKEEGVCAGPEFVERESKGEGNLLENDEAEEEELVVVVVVVEEEGEGERYLEGTCFPLGFLAGT